MTFDRRRFLVVGAGGLGVALLGGCGKGAKSVAPSGPRSATTVPGQGDVVILRTLSSVEALAAATYNHILARGLVTVAVQVTLLRDLAAHHRAHMGAVAAATTDAGGSPMTDPNPVIDAQVVRPALGRIRSQADALALAYAIESLLAQTYQATIGTFGQPAHTAVAGAIGGVEARHVTAVGIALSDAPYPTFPSEGFQSANAAVPAGTGV